MQSENKIIQFFHPGKVSKSGEWNTAEHKRKLIYNMITCIDNKGDSKTQKGYFWGEWEAQSEVYHSENYYIHTPSYPTPEVINFKSSDLVSVKCSKTNCSGNTELLNTDPYVFGNYFIYSNCLQKAHKNVLQHLGENDIIIFGSLKDDGFVVDTVFVVDKKVEIKDCSKCFKIATGNLIKNGDYIIYKGKTYNSDKPEDIYSFFPCSDKPFDRPKLCLDYFHQKKNQDVYYIHKYHSDLTSKKVWSDIKRQVIDSGLLIGIKTEEPIEKW